MLQQHSYIEICALLSSGRCVEEKNHNFALEKITKTNNPVLISSSSHNWNSLFLGANAVADVLAEKYEAEKSKILDLVS